MAPFCPHCLHYRLTYEADRPHACLEWDIKTVQMPSLELRLATGHDCPQWTDNPKIQRDRSRDAQAAPGRSGRPGRRLPRPEAGGLLGPDGLTV